MAKIQRIVRADNISRFQQAAPSGGAAFRVLADSLNDVYEQIEPGIIEAVEAEASEAFRAKARRDVGNGGRLSYVSSKGTDLDFTPYAVGGAAARSDSFTGLDTEFASRVHAMTQAAHAAGIPLQITSAYRSPELQEELYNAAVQKYGSPEAARKWVAPPGKSKHNDGTAVDFAVDGGLIRDGNSAEAKWIAENAAQFGLHVPMSWEPWQVEKAGSRGGTEHVSTKSAPAVTVRGAGGNLEPRLFSPYSGPILRAHNAAAGVAYQAEVIEKASIDLMNISAQFPLDPQGYAQAAQQYVDQIVEDAPDLFRMDLRNTLEREMARRELGLADEKNKDTRRRAANSSAALVERWSLNYAEALAAGNKDEADAARAELDGLLRAREVLPGLSWTPEQSANVLLGAERKAEEIASSSLKKVKSETKDNLNLIIDAAKANRHSDFEDILNDPAIEVLHPELFREARAFVALRDSRPDFNKLPPAVQKAEVAQLKSQSVSEEWQIDVADAAEAIATENAKAWKDDPIQRAVEVLNIEGLPDAIDLNDLSSISKALDQRVLDAQGLVEEGYIDEVALFSKDEAAALGEFLAPGVPPEIRAGFLGVLSASLGVHTMKALSQIGGDEVALHVGKRMASGLPERVGVEMLRGSQMIAEGVSSAPTKAKMDAALSGILPALGGVPGDVKAMAEIKKSAGALFAARSAGAGEDADLDELLETAVQETLGQSTSPLGVVVGGVQEVGGHQTLLPPDLNGEEVSDILQYLSPQTSSDYALFDRLGDGFDIDEFWAKSGANSAPLFNGKPIPHVYIRRENIRMVPVRGSAYRMELVLAGTSFPLEDSAGNVFMFDIHKMMEAKR